MNWIQILIETNATKNMKISLKENFLLWHLKNKISFPLKLKSNFQTHNGIHDIYLKDNGFSFMLIKTDFKPQNDEWFNAWKSMLWRFWWCWFSTSIITILLNILINNQSSAYDNSLCSLQQFCLELIL